MSETIQTTDADAIAAAHAAAEAAAQAAAVHDPATFASLQAPVGATECSWGGETYKVDKKGRVRVPQPAVVDLVAHGFVPAAD